MQFFTSNSGWRQSSSPSFLSFPDRQMQVKSERLLWAHSVQRTNVLLQPLMTSMTVFAALHPLDQFLPSGGNVHARVSHFQVGDRIQPTGELDDLCLPIRLHRFIHGDPHIVAI